MITQPNCFSSNQVPLKSPLSPTVNGPSSVSVMSYEGTILSESKPRSKTSQSSAANTTNKDLTKHAHLLPNKPNSPSLRASSTLSLDRSGGEKRLPIKNVFVPGTGWASQVRKLLLLFTSQVFLSVKKSKMSAANLQSTPDSFQAMQSRK